MDIKLELLKRPISELVTRNLPELNINPDKIAEWLYFYTNLLSLSIWKPNKNSQQHFFAADCFFHILLPPAKPLYSSRYHSPCLRIHTDISSPLNASVILTPPV